MTRANVGRSNAGDIIEQRRRARGWRRTPAASRCAVPQKNKTRGALRPRAGAHRAAARRAPCARRSRACVARRGTTSRRKCRPRRGQARPPANTPMSTTDNRRGAIESAVDLLERAHIRRRQIGIERADLAPNRGGERTRILRAAHGENHAAIRALIVRRGSTPASDPDPDRDAACRRPRRRS